MNRYVLALASGLMLALATAGAAAADEVDPNFLSKLRSVSPAVEGLEVEVVKRGDEFEVQNETGKSLLVEGYGGEPYLRFLPNGTVLENQRSPSTYLNKDRYATQKVPGFAKTKARPLWKRVATNGAYEWHDHRIHYMGKGTPRQVKDESERQKVFDWKVDMQLAGRPVVASGSLSWIPTPGSDDGGGGALWIVLAAALALLAAALGVVIARRRRARPGPAGAGEAPPDTEAW